MLNNIDVTKFPIDNRLKDLLSNTGDKSLEQFLYNLELYVVCTRDKLIEYINEQMNISNLKNIQSINKESFVKPSDTQIKKIQDTIEKTHDVLLSRNSEGRILVVTSLFNELDLASLGLSLGTVNFEEVRVTPYNYDLLKYNKHQEYNTFILFNRIIIEAIIKGVSDIQFRVKHKNKIPYASIAFRESEGVIEWNKLKLDVRTLTSLMTEIISKRTEGLESDLRSHGLSVSIPDVLGDNYCDIRLTASVSVKGVIVTIRLQKGKVLTIDELGFDNKAIDDLKFLTKLAGGCTFITGRKNSGKNTTMYALAMELNKKAINMIEYTNPTEFLMDFVQIPYRDNIDYLKEQLSLSKKHDLDVALLNEIPNSEVAMCVKDLTCSDIKVLTTFHMNRAWDLPLKLHEFYGDLYTHMLLQINGICNQKMFPIQCPYCTERVGIETTDKYLLPIFNRLNIPSVIVNKGCKHCNYKGFIPGKVQPYVEIVIFTEELKRKLTKIGDPIAVREYLFNYMHEKQITLEYKLRDAINCGKVHYSCLYQLV